MKKILTEDELLAELKEVAAVPEAHSVDALEKTVLESNDRFIVIIEDIQNMFLRTVDGLRTIERFLLFVTRTDERIYWVVTCSRYAWQ